MPLMPRFLHNLPRPDATPDIPPNAIQMLVNVSTLALASVPIGCATIFTVTELSGRRLPSAWQNFGIPGAFVFGVITCFAAGIIMVSSLFCLNPRLFFIAMLFGFFWTLDSAVAIVTAIPGDPTIDPCEPLLFFVMSFVYGFRAIMYLKWRV